jgi:hypothetical protein
MSGGGGGGGNGNDGSAVSTGFPKFPMWYDKPWTDDASLASSMREADENERDKGVADR